MIPQGVFLLPFYYITFQGLTNPILSSRSLLFLKRDDIHAMHLTVLPCPKSNLL